MLGQKYTKNYESFIEKDTKVVKAPYYISP